jgi:hypothetical protein
VRRHYIITYLVAVLIIIGQFCCQAYLVFTNSDKTLYLAIPTLLTAWILAAAEQIRTLETIRREAYLAAIRRINRLN